MIGGPSGLTFVLNAWATVGSSASEPKWSLGTQLVGDVLNDDGSFGEELTVVQYDGRNVPFGIDGEVVLAGGRLLGAIVHLHELEREIGFAQGDMRRE